MHNRNFLTDKNYSHNYSNKNSRAHCGSLNNFDYRYCILKASKRFALKVHVMLMTQRDLSHIVMHI